MRELIDDMIEHKNPDRQGKMESYMRNKFKFLGIQAKDRYEISKDYFSEAKKTKTIDWDFIFLCWESDYREIQYIALDYLKGMERYLEKNDIKNIEILIVNKSWWDSVDNLNRPVAYLVDKYEDLKPTILEWSRDDNMWLRRMSIIYQLRLKEDTDLDILTLVIDNNLGTDEFFINKAIGWALRQYSKVDAKWVESFIEDRENLLSSLTKKEASKYL